MESWLFLGCCILREKCKSKHRLFIVTHFLTRSLITFSANNKQNKKQNTSLFDPRCFDLIHLILLSQSKQRASQVFAEILFCFGRSPLATSDTQTDNSSDKLIFLDSHFICLYLSHVDFYSRLGILICIYFSK